MNAMFDRTRVTSGFDTETLVSEEYLTYLILAQIEAGLFPLELRLERAPTGDDPGFDVTVILHPPERYERRYDPEPTAILPQAVPGSFDFQLLPDDPEPMSFVAYGAGGTRIATGSPDGFVRVWNVGNRSPLLAFQQPGSVTGLAFTPDDARLVTTSIDGRLRVWNAADGTAEATLNGHAGPAFGLAVSPDGNRVVSGGSDRVVRIHDLQSGEQIKAFQGHDAPVLAVAFAPDGGRVASGSQDGTVRVWDSEAGTGVDVPPGQEVHVLGGHDGAVHAVAFSPGGQRIASGSADTTVRLWNASSGAAVASLEGHEGAVNAVAFRPIGNLLASASADGDVRLWPAQGGATLRILRGHRRPVLSLGFSPDGERLATGSEDRTARFWEMPGGEADGFVAVPFMSLRVIVTIVDNRTGEQREEAPVGLLLGFDLEAQQTADALERNHALRLSLVRLDDLTRFVLETQELDPLEVEDEIRRHLDRRVDLGLAQGLSVQQVRMRKFVSPSHNSLGFYLDLALRSGPQAGAFVPPRGSLGLAQDFRDPAKPLAFATSPGLFDLLGPDLKFQQAEESPPGSGEFRFPLREDFLDPSSDEIGRLKGVAFGPERQPSVPQLPTGNLLINVHGEYTKAIGNPDFNVHVVLSPLVRDRLLEWDIDVRVKFGLGATLFLIFVGMVLGLMFPPAFGLGSKLVIGALLGAAVLKGLITEPLAARILEDRIDFAEQASVLDSLPARVPAARRRWDPFYVTEHQVVALSDEPIIIDEGGIAFEGEELALDKQPNTIVHVVIRDEERDDDGAVTALRYRVRDFLRVEADLEAVAPGVDRMPFRRTDPEGEPTFVSLTDQEIAERMEAGRIFAPINYTPERIYLVENKIQLLLCLSRIERAEERGRLIREFREGMASVLRNGSEEAAELREQVVLDLEDALGRPPTDDEVREEVDRRIEALVNARQPEFEKDELPDLLEDAVARALRFDLVPAEWAERWRAGVLALPDDKEIVTRRNPSGTTTTYIRDRPDGVLHDNLLELPRYIAPYTPPD